MFLLVLSSVGFVYANGDTFGKKEVVDKTQQIGGDGVHTKFKGVLSVKACCGIRSDKKIEYKFVDQNQCQAKDVEDEENCKINKRCETFFLGASKDYYLGLGKALFSTRDFCISNGYKICTRVDGSSSLGVLSCATTYNACANGQSDSDTSEKVRDFYLNHFVNSNGKQVKLTYLGNENGKDYATVLVYDGKDINNGKSGKLFVGDSQNIEGIDIKLRKINFNNNVPDCLVNDKPFGINLTIDQAYTFKGKLIKLEGINGNSALINVDGQSDSLDKGDSKVINGVKLYLDYLVDNDDDTQDSVGLRVLIYNVNNDYNYLCKAKLLYYQNEVIFDNKLIKFTSWDVNDMIVDIEVGGVKGRITKGFTEIINDVEIYVSDMYSGGNNNPYADIIIGKRGYATLELPITEYVGSGSLNCDFDDVKNDFKFKLNTVKCCSFD